MLDRLQTSLTSKKHHTNDLINLSCDITKHKNGQGLEARDEIWKQQTY